MLALLVLALQVVLVAPEDNLLLQEIGEDEAAGINKNFTSSQVCDAWYDTEDPMLSAPEDQCPCGLKERACVICKPNDEMMDEDGVCGFICIPKDEPCNTRDVEEEDERLIEEEEEYIESAVEEKYFAVSIVLVVIVMVAQGVHALHMAAVQESMAFIILGIILGVGIRIWAAEAEGGARLFFKNSVEFNSDYFFFVLLPPIILEAGFSLKKARFIRNSTSILAFAFIGTLISTFVVGMMIWQGGKYVGATKENVGIDFETPFDSLKFGAMISATDPVATLSVLSSMRPMKDPDLYSMIFGESVLNDAIAVVLFTVFEKMGLSGSVGARSVAGAIGEFFKVSIGSTIMGVGIGLLSALTTRRLLNGAGHEAKALAEGHEDDEHGGVEHHFEVSIVLLFAYAAYVCADTNGLSGIMALFFCGITMGHYTKYNLSQAAKHVTITGFKTMGFVAEAAVFTYLGVDFILADWGDNGHFHWGFIGLCIAAMLLSRALNIFPIAFLLNKTVRRGRSIPPSESSNVFCLTTRSSDVRPLLWTESQFMLWFAGLRGAIAYALAKRWGGLRTTQAVEGTTVILVLVTTFGLGGTVGWVLKKLDMEMEEGDEVQLSSLDSFKNYFEQSAFGTEGVETAASTTLRGSSQTKEGEKANDMWREGLVAEKQASHRSVRAPCPCCASLRWERWLGRISCRRGRTRASSTWTRRSSVGLVRAPPEHFLRMKKTLPETKSHEHV